MFFASQGSSIGLPIGSVIAWPFANAIPQDYLECNGQTVNAALYPKLVALCSNVPNYQGMFLRGYGNQFYTDTYGAINHSSNDLGSIQGDTIRNIVGGWNSGDNEMADSLWGAFYHGPYHNGPNLGCGNDYSWESGTLDVSRVVPTSTENRPVNIAVRYIIKAK